MLQHGIDLHKRSITVATLDEQGEVLARGKLPAHRSALVQYLSAWEGPQRATAECTGSWYWVADLCAAQGVEFHLAHAHQTKAIASAKVKTDAVDALTLAKLLRADFLPEAHQVPAEVREQRDVLRARLRLVGRRTSVKNSIARVLEKYNVSSADRLPPLARVQVGLHQEQVELLDRQIRETVRLLHQPLLEDEAVQRLLWVPGIGAIGALTIRLEVDDIARFASERHFFSYCRLVPGADNSGDRRRHRPSKAGNRYLKVTFSHAAVRAIQNYSVVRDFYRRKARQKNRFIARALVAKELARIVYHMLQRGTDYNGTFKGEPLGASKKSRWPRRTSPGIGLDSFDSTRERGSPRS